MKKNVQIEVGRDINGIRVNIDLDTLIRTRGYVSASSGGGKSHLLRRLIEQICPHVQCIVLDWEGEYSTLRKKFPFVLVGEGGETPAHPHTAAQVALTLLELGASAVCDLYELKGNDRHNFVRNFVGALVNSPKELWHPVVIIIDEAHYLCPENGYGESVAKEAIIDLCNLGRKRGFCPILATQRASKVSKNAVEPLQNFLIGLTMPDDHKRVTDTFKVAPGASKREFEKQLMTLEQGWFFVRGAAISKEQRLIMVGKTETDPPPTGSAAAARRTPTPDAIKKLLPKLEDIPIEAERKAKTESDLRAEVKELKRQLSLKSAPQSNPKRERMLLEQINTLETNLASAKKVAGAYTKAMEGIYSHATKMQDAAINIKSIVDSVRDHVDAMPSASSPAPKPTFSPGLRGTVKPEFVAASLEKTDAVIHDGLTGPEQRVLDAIAFWEVAMPHRIPPLIAVAMIANYTVNGTFNNLKATLRNKNLVEYQNGSLIFGMQGRSAANFPTIKPDNEGVQSLILSRLDGPQQRVLAHLIKQYPRTVKADALAEASGYTVNGTFNNIKGKLRTLGIIRYESGASVAESWLFPEGV